MPQSHLCPVEVEEVHQFDGTAFLKSPIIYPTWLVIELDVNREYFGLLYVRKVSGFARGRERVIRTEVDLVGRLGVGGRRSLGILEGKELL